MGHEATQVFLRVRPLNRREQGTTAAARCLEVLDSTQLRYTGRDGPANSQFGFDRVYGEESSQAEAFEARGWAAQRRVFRQRRRRSAAGTSLPLPPPRRRPLALALHLLQGMKETVACVLQGFNATILAYGQTVRDVYGCR